MLFICRRNWIRTLCALLVIILSVGSCLYPATLYGVWSVAGFAYVVVFCVLFTYGFGVLSDLYRPLEGNWENYEMVTDIDSDNIILSHTTKEMGLKLVDGLFPFIVSTHLNPTLSCLKVRIGKRRKMTQIRRYRIRKLSQYILLWSRKERYKLTHGPSLTYVVDHLDDGTIALSEASGMDTVVDQKLITSRLMLDGITLNSATCLLEQVDGKFIVKLPQETDRLLGLQFGVLYMTRDGFVVPNEWLENSFASERLRTECTNLLQLCKEQINNRIKMTSFDLDVIGLCLRVDELGTPVVICKVGIPTTIDELKHNIGNLVGEPIRLSEYLQNNPATMVDAMIVYFMKKQIRADKRKKRAAIGGIQTRWR